MEHHDVFVDTSGFYALWDASDSHHRRAVELQRSLVREGIAFVTTDYILDETATLLNARHSRTAASDFLATMRDTQFVHLVWMQPMMFQKVSLYFESSQDKNWSFTDCFSFCLMRERSLTRAFTTDHHFVQAGFDTLLKQT